MIPLLLAIQVLAIGDSITQDNTAYGITSFPAFVTCCDVYNAARNGTTTEDWLQQIVPWTEDGLLSSPDFVAIELGSANAIWELGPDDFEQDMHDIVDYLIAEGVEGIVLSIPPYVLESIPVTLVWNDIIDELAIRIQNVVDAYPQVRLGVDLRQLDLTYFDDVHPDTASHQFVIAPAYDEAWLVPEPGVMLQLVAGAGVIGLFEWRRG